jgi:hypothetical protein
LWTLAVVRGADDKANKGKSGTSVHVKEGSVGPFDYKIIKAIEKNPSTIREWLVDNGYDEYVGSAELTNYYVQHDHYFVALLLKTRLPAIFPDDMETIACIPWILTGVAAIRTMSIQVYILGDHRAEPVNYFRVELDDTQVDWLGCQGNPGCFDRDYRDRAASAFKVVNDVSNVCTSGETQN